MHKVILFALLAGVAVEGQPNVTSLIVDDVGFNGGHSSFRVTWNTDVSVDRQRIQWGPTSALGRVHYPYSFNNSAANQQLLITGLEPGTDMDANRNVYFCVQSHNGAGWSPCNVQTVTIPPKPDVHPATATLPATFEFPQPSETGCTVQTVASDLSNLQTIFNTAALNQVAVCQVIILPAGSAGSIYGVVPTAADADWVTSNSTTNTITLTTSANTYSNGDRVRVSSNLDASTDTPIGIAEGADYCAVNVSGTTLQLAPWPACSGVVPLGTQRSAAWNLMPFPPRHSNWVVVRCGGTYPPEGVRINPDWQAPSNTCRWRPNGLGVNENVNNSLRFGTFAHHWYIGPGIDFSVIPSGQNNTTDPTPWPPRMSMRPSDSYIAIKRNWVTGLSYPERQENTLKFEGSYIDFGENYLSGIDYWRPAKTGFAPTFVGSGLSFAGGSYNTGIGNCPSVAASTMRLTSSTAGTAFVTLRPSDCMVIATLPGGTTATCSGCTVATGTQFPLTPAGRYAQGLIAACYFAAGTWSRCDIYDDVNNVFSVFYNDSIQNIVSYGPGPMRFANNYESSHGIFWHLDDSGVNTPAVVASDIVFARNVFATPNKYINGAPGSDGFTYRNRNQWECKRCSRVLLTGNEFYGEYKDFANDGPTILINGNAALSLTWPLQSQAGDFTVISNLIHNASDGIQLGGGPPGANNIPNLGRKFTIKNNLIYNINGYVQYGVRPAGLFSNGWCFQTSHGGEDVIIDHNTCYSAGGKAPQFLQVVGKMVEGLKFTNNAFYFHEDGGYNGMLIDWGSQGIGVPNCFTVPGTAGFNCFTNNVSQFANNLLIPGYNNSQTLTGDSNVTAFAALWAGPPNFIPGNSLVAARVASARWSSPANNNFRFLPSSPYISGGASRGTDNLDVGVNQDALEDALGWIKNVRTAAVTATGFTAVFHAPDPSGACYVGYGNSTNPVTWQRTAADTSASQERSISVTGLTPQTTYSFQIWCANTAVTVTETVRTP